MDEMTKVLSELFTVVKRLEKLLAPYKEEISGVCPKPLSEMSISEKVKLANLIFAVRNKGPEARP